MSEVGLREGDPEPTNLVPTPETVTETTQENTETPATETTTEPETKVDAPKPPERKVPKWAEERFGELTRQKGDLARELESARKERDLFKAMSEGRQAVEGQPQDQQAKPNGSLPTQDELQRLIMAEAAKFSAQAEQQKATQTFFASGRKDYPDFNDRCTLIDSLGAVERPEFVQIVTQMGDGPKVVAKLADEPEEARRILSLPPLLMAQELAKISFGISAPKSAQVSGAPSPIRPLDGAARAVSEPTDDTPEDEWFKLREKHVVAKKGKRT